MPHPAVGIALPAWSGPLALLALRGLTLPDKIFTVDAAESAQALTTGVGNSDMDEMEL